MALGLSSCVENEAPVTTVVSRKDSSIPFACELPGKEDYSLWAYKIKLKRETKLHIDRLENGYDSIQVRIWYGPFQYMNRDLVIIKYSKGAWSGEHFIYTVDWQESAKEVIITKKRRPVAPKSGWADFTRNLFADSITTLPDMHKIPGLNDGILDGMNYYVEVATADSYRFYTYHEPSLFEQEFPQARKMMDVIRLLKQEFGVGFGR
ncbi:MAG: hypothetical protein JST39_09735 [Bacteroidetes bacterium]|nr:hypothetical protein [Bacteroidota bacterium]